MAYYNPHLIYDVAIDFAKDWTLDFWLYVKPGRPVGSSTFDEYFMAISPNQFFRLDTSVRPNLHCTWLGFMGNEETGISGPLTPGGWYHMALICKQNVEWYFYVNGKLTTQGIASSSGSGGE